MRKRNLLYFLLCLVLSVPATVLNAQDTDEKVFPESGAVWSTYAFHREKPTENYIYGLIGDTLINEKEYSKLYLLSDTLLVIDEESVYVAGIRQEKKVVYMQPASNQWGETLEEFVLYDFSKTIGEKVSYKRPYSSPVEVFSTFIDVEILCPYNDMYIMKEKDTEYGRMIEVEGWYELWIEKIGSLSGLLFAPMDFALDGTVIWVGGLLGCMKQDGKIIYMNEEFCNQCFGKLKYDPNLSIGNETVNSPRIWYKKLDRSIEIESQHLTELAVFRMINIEGKEVFKQQIDNDKTSLKIPFIPQGIYIYQISGAINTQTGKIIIN